MAYSSCWVAQWHPCLATTLKSSPDAGLSPGAALVIGNGRSADVIAFEAQVVDFFVGAADLLGLVPEYHPHLEPT